MRTNVAAKNKAVTHGGGSSRNPENSKQLTRLVASCMLFENTHYDSGSRVASAITDLCTKVPVEVISSLAMRARNEWHLRHIPLFLIAQLDKRRLESPGLLAYTVAGTISRPDEMAELLSILQKVNGGRPLKKILSAQIKKGLAKVFATFNEFQLAKWNRDAAIKLRDVLFLTHAKPQTRAQQKSWKKLIDNTLPTPDTWETELSAGKDKAEVWNRLLREEKLGGMALLMNLRNMLQVGVSKDVIGRALDTHSFKHVLPFRFISAMRHAPGLEDRLDKAMIRVLAGEEKLPGSTLLVVDISGSMGATLSGSGEVTRLDAANSLAILIREIGESVTVYATAGNDHRGVHATAEVASRHGMALAEAIADKGVDLGHGGIFLAQCMEYIHRHEHGKPFDRVIVITDEQDCDYPRNTAGAKMMGEMNYIINVATEVPAMELSAGWVRINGFSERVIDYIRFEENADDVVEQVMNPPNFRESITIGNPIPRKPAAVKAKKVTKSKTAKKVTKKAVKKSAKKVAKKSVKRSAR